MNTFEYVKMKQKHWAIHERRSLSEFSRAGSGTGFAAEQQTN